MQKKLKLFVMALCIAPTLHAQEADSLSVEMQEEQAFTFTEAQLGTDDDMSQNVIIVSSNQNIYASQAGYLFSPGRFRYRAFNQKYNDIYINGLLMNDMESGQFRYSMVGGLNQQTRTAENALPFEFNNFSMAGMGGSNNYDFRPSHFAAGHRVSLAAANRNYTLRGMYTYNSGLNSKGWAYTASLTYRWAGRGYVEGTFYNSLSYFLGIEKKFNDKHSLSLVTWGNPTERGSQGAATDEVYWLTNNNHYNPYWGYQNGQKRNSRVVHDFSPTALLTWDWNINDHMKLTTSLSGRYSTYKSTSLQYNNSENPSPIYWKNLPSYHFDVWYNDPINTDIALAKYNQVRDYWMSGVGTQINFDRLYYSNMMANKTGMDAMYFIQAKHNNNLNFALSSSLKADLSKFISMNVGLQLATNKGMHYVTIDDLMGSNGLHNYNSYSLSKYPLGTPMGFRSLYDMNNPDVVLHNGDRYKYDYNLYVNKATAWTSWKYTRGNLHAFLAARIGGTTMSRQGNMRNGMGQIVNVDEGGTYYIEYDNSYGQSGTAKFLDGGFKLGSAIVLGKGHTVNFGIGYESRAPQASTAFVSPEINNNFVSNLKNEKVFSTEVGYQLSTSWFKANINGYLSYMRDVTEWQNFYDDDARAFTYVSITGAKKIYYGLEWGLKFRLSDAFDLKALGTVSDAKYTENSFVRYMNSAEATMHDDILYNKNMREGGTPLNIYSLVLSYHSRGWFIDLIGNYYDRIYLSYSPSYRYGETLKNRQKSWETDKYSPNVGPWIYDPNTVITDGEYEYYLVNPEAIAQAKGTGGFMLDVNIGKTIRIRRGGQLSINLMITNLLNNQKIVTGGYEQSRSNYSVNDGGTLGNARAYKFDRNPFKYYAYGVNGMLNVSYKF